MEYRRCYAELYRYTAIPPYTCASSAPHPLHVLPYILPHILPLLLPVQDELDGPLRLSSGMNGMSGTNYLGLSSNGSDQGESPSPPIGGGKGAVQVGQADQVATLQQEQQAQQQERKSRQELLRYTSLYTSSYMPSNIKT